MNDIEKLFGGLGDWCQDILNKAKETIKTTEISLGENRKRVTVELPEPSSDDDAAWRKACNARILDAIPEGYLLKSSEIKEETFVRRYADLIVEKS